MKNGRFLRGSDEVITSRQNAFVKELCALSEKKQREKCGLFRFDGLKLCEEALRTGVEITAVAVRESSLERVESWLQDRVGSGGFSPECRVKILADGVFEKISEEKSPDGIICAAKALDKFHKITTINNIPENLKHLSADGQPARILFLAELRDPGNVGTVLRTAAAFGIECVLLSKDVADLYQPRTLRASMGAIFRLPTLRVDGSVADAIRVLRESGRRVYATALDDTASALGEFPLSRGDCFVIGNEGHGLSADVIAAATHSVYIPMAPGSESLNAAIAATVCMWELRKAD